MYLTIQGVVLRVSDYNDHDALLTVLTRKHGKLTVKARGLRRKNSPLAAVCQLLAYGEFTVFEYRGQYTINEAHVLNLFQNLRADLEQLSLASYFAQVAEVLSQEDYPTPDLQSLLLNCLYGLSNLKQPLDQVKAVFELRAACLSGYTPDLFGCHVCGSQTPDRFDLSSGLLECQNCRDASSGGIRLPVTPGIFRSSPFAAASRNSGGHALHMLLRPQKALFFSVESAGAAPAFPGDGGLSHHPAGTELFGIGLL